MVGYIYTVFTQTIQTGLQASAMYVKRSNAFFLERAAVSTLPFSIDDPPRTRSGSGSSLDISDLVVDLYNGSKTANLRKGSLEPWSIPLVASNFKLDSDQRYNTWYTYFENHPLNLQYFSYFKCGYIVPVITFRFRVVNPHSVNKYI